MSHASVSYRANPIIGLLVIILCNAASSAAELKERGLDALRMNEIQVVGTHNSYHIAPHPALLGLMGKTDARLQTSLDYTHRPLTEQFDRLGMRQIELDLFADPEGGRYAHPAAYAMAKELGVDIGAPHDPQGKLRAPGLKVLHVQDVDFRSNVLTFRDALREIRRWSNANPWHVPILVLVELKEEMPRVPLTRPLPFDASQLDQVDAEIGSEFDARQIISPDSVRGDSDTLREAIVTRGWPLLSNVRGKVLFALDNESAVRDRYLQGHPSLRGRKLFVSVPPDHPAAAFRKLNDPVRQFDEIRNAVAAGFLVRTRADAGTEEARSNATNRRDQALASGAQFVSTDYPQPDHRFGKYRTRLPDGVVARVNPVPWNGAPAIGRQPSDWQTAGAAIDVEQAVEQSE